MKKLYEKNELAFSLLWIVIYVTGTSLAEMLSEILGVFRLVSAAFHVGTAAGLYLWIRRNGLAGKYGLMLPRYRLRQALFFIPLILVCLYKPAFSPALRYTPAESALFVTGMLGVGFLEEIIFRGFLFRAIEKENLTRAIMISSVTFGIGHIVNLLNGRDLFETVGQIVFAVFAGFALVVLFYRGKSLVPCIAFHGIFNALSVIANDEALYSAFGGPVPATVIMISAGAVVLGGYCVWNWKHLDA